MKNLNSLLIAILISAGTIKASASGIESSMGGFKLQTCSESAHQCLTVKAERTQGSQLKQLHTLTKPEVIITSQKNPAMQIIEIKGDTGYVDLEENQVIVYKRNAKSLLETSINLTTFERLHMKHGDL